MIPQKISSVRNKPSQEVTRQSQNSSFETVLLSLIAWGSLPQKESRVQGLVQGSEHSDCVWHLGLKKRNPRRTEGSNPES